MKEMKDYWDEEEKILKDHYFLKNNKLHGLFQLWYEDGQKREEYHYVNGIRYKSQEEYEEQLIMNKSW